MDDLAGKVPVVTGAGRPQDLGRVTALRLAQEGARLGKPPCRMVVVLLMAAVLTVDFTHQLRAQSPLAVTNGVSLLQITQ
jgi:hypothetical protein